MLVAQGDLLIERVASMPAGRALLPDHGRIILAKGEATGHHHSVPAAVCDRAVVVDMEVVEAVFLRLIAPAEITHQEHGPIALCPGIYRVTRQREYSPEAVRRVED